MARTPYATESHNSPNKSERNPSNGQPSYIVLHHAASTSFDSVVRMCNGAKQVSATAVLKDNQVASMFDERYRAWSLSSAFWDSVSLSVEVCNESTNGWTISEASYSTLAKVVADWCKRYGIPCDREHIMGHREVNTRYNASYPTACPGGLDLDRVVREARSLLAQWAFASSGFKPIDLLGEDIMALVVNHTESGGIFLVAQEYIAHFTSVANAQYIANLLTTDDKIIVQNTSEFQTTLRAFGIPFEHPDRLATQDAGGSWSRGAANANLLSAIVDKLAE